jgi:ATP-binding cassette subfamily F protein uup
LNLLTLQAVSKQFTERILLDQVDLRINQGDRIGLVGANGSGKTTLLRMIAGRESADEGDLTIWGGVSVQLLDQEPDLNDALSVLENLFQSDSPQMRVVRDFQRANQDLLAAPENAAHQANLVKVTEQMDRLNGWAAEARAKAILSKLGVQSSPADSQVGSPDAIHFGQQVATLSGGERKRLALAQALLDPADLLILDEPTNHLDAETIDWLESYLLEMSTALLMVTHDRYFLQRVANRIIELDRRKLVSYSGNYSSYLTQRQQREAAEAVGARRRHSQLRRELAWLNQGIRARGTRSKHRKEQALDLLDRSQTESLPTVAIALASRRLGKRVFTGKGIRLAYGNRTILNGIDLELEPGERIGIIGPNGAGKTSLLEGLLGYVPVEGSLDWGETVQVGYFDQQAAALQGDQPQAKRIIDFVDDIAAVIRTDSGQLVDAAQILTWFLFDRPQQRARLSSLSGGERRRLNLLRALAYQPNVLILDEPTNDLDLQTLQVFEEFLDHFKGTLIVVSHDRYFLDRNVDFLMKLEGGQLSGRYPTPYESFMRLSAPTTAETRAAPRPKAVPAAPDLSVRVAKLSYNEQREFDALSLRIAEIEAEQPALESELAQAGQDYLRLQTLSEQLSALEREYDLAIERWMELEGRSNK